MSQPADPEEGKDSRGGLAAIRIGALEDGYYVKGVDAEGRDEVDGDAHLFGGTWGSTEDMKREFGGRVDPEAVPDEEPLNVRGLVGGAPTVVDEESGNVVAVFGSAGLFNAAQGHTRHLNSRGTTITGPARATARDILGRPKEEDETLPEYGAKVREAVEEEHGETFEQVLKSARTTAEETHPESPDDYKGRPWNAPPPTLSADHIVIPVRDHPDHVVDSTKRGFPTSTEEVYDMVPDGFEDVIVPLRPNEHADITAEGLEVSRGLEEENQDRIVDRKAREIAADNDEDELDRLAELADGVGPKTVEAIRSSELDIDDLRENPEEVTGVGETKAEAMRDALEEIDAEETETGVENAR